jgi:hypothetical protein
MLFHYSIHELFAPFTTKGRRNVCRIITWPLLVAHCEMPVVAHSVSTLQVTRDWFMTAITILGYQRLDIWVKARRTCFKFRPFDTIVFRVHLHFLHQKAKEYLLTIVYSNSVIQCNSVMYIQFKKVLPNFKRAYIPIKTINYVLAWWELTGWPTACREEDRRT